MFRTVPVPLNCPKYVEFYSKYTFEKLVHVIGFIIRSYQDARSPELQTNCGGSTVVCQAASISLQWGPLSCTFKLVQHFPSVT